MLSAHPVRAARRRGRRGRAGHAGRPRRGGAPGGAAAVSDAALERLAMRAGIAVHWHDDRGEAHRVGADSLRALLAALGLPAGSAAECRDREAAMDAEEDAPRPVYTTEPGDRVRCPGLRPGERVRIAGADGARDSVVEGGDGPWLLAPG